MSELSRERHLLLGLLAFLAPIPLPFNEVVLWPVLVLYLLVVGLFLARRRSGSYRQLPTWALNVLGLAYLPVLFLDLITGALAGQLARTMVHVCMFAVVVKLFALGRLRDEKLTFLTAFFLFLASMGTSVHPSVLLYLLAFAGLALTLLTRYALSRTLAETSVADAGAIRLEPPRLAGFLTAAIAVALLLGVPIFALFPRVQTPYVGLRTGAGTEMRSTGFSDEVTLDTIGGLRDNPEVAMRLQFQHLPSADADLRFKGSTYEVYEDRRWSRSRLHEMSLNNYRGGFELRAGPEVGWVDVWLQPISSRSVILPVETLRFDLPMPVLRMDNGGAVFRWGNYNGVLPYRAWLAARPVLTAVEPQLDDPSEPTLDRTGATPEVARLAAEVMGEGPPAEQARQLQDYLIRELSYTTDRVGAIGDHPIEDFLFRYRAGHCELFASSMVLMLRTRGIPARLVTGFLGAEYNRLTGYFVVRQGNAHAWVEAYLPGSGWQIFDPTPPAGRPSAAGLGDFSLLRQLSDFVIFRWDRYVLTYGFQDQVSFFWRLRDALQDLVELFSRERSERSAGGTGGAGPAAATAGSPVADSAAAGGLTLAFFALALALIAGISWYQLRRPLTAARAFRELRRLAQRAGLPVTAATAPIALRQQAVQRFPAARAATEHIVDVYLRESFGDRPAGDDEVRRLRQEVAALKRELRRKRRSRT